MATLNQPRSTAIVAVSMDLPPRSGLTPSEIWVTSWRRDGTGPKACAPVLGLGAEYNE